MGKEQDPYLDSELKGWLVNYARKQYWKVASWYEFDDLIQDGYMVYAKCRRRFRGNAVPTDEDRRTMMVYFQRAFANYMTDLQQNPRSRQQEVGFSQFTVEQESELVDSLLGAHDLSDVGLATVLTRAPAEIVAMIKSLLVDGVADVAPLARPLASAGVRGKRRRRVPVVRELTSERIDRCLGQVGAAARIKEYLMSSA